MKSNSSKIPRVLHAIFATLTIAALVWLAQKNIVPGGRVAYAQNFSARSPFVSDLWPPDALGSVQKLTNGEGARQITDDKTTFFVRPTRKFENARIKITFEELNGLEPHFEALNALGYWQPIDWATISQDKLAYEAQVELKTPIAKDANQRYNFGLLIPGVRLGGKPVLIKKIEVELKGERANLKNIWHLLKY